MSKIQNTSRQSSLATWLTVAANEQNDDWPASVSLVSGQPVIGWLKDEVARHCIVHRPCAHGNLPLPCIVRNGEWYCAKCSSLKSFYVLHRHIASIPNPKMKFCGSVVWVRWQQIEKYIWYFAGLSQVFIFWEMCKIWRDSWYFVCSKINQNDIKFGFKVDWQFLTTMTW